MKIRNKEGRNKGTQSMCVCGSDVGCNFNKVVSVRLGRLDLSKDLKEMKKLAKQISKRRKH